MARPKRNKEHRDATESTSKTGEDWTDTGDPQAPTSSAAGAPSPSEETDPVTDETAGRSTDEDKKEIVETTTKAAAIVKPKVKVGPPMCPHCHERRYPQELKGKKIKCTNCRTMQTLI